MKWLQAIREQVLRNNVRSPGRMLFPLPLPSICNSVQATAGKRRELVTYLTWLLHHLLLSVHGTFTRFHISLVRSVRQKLDNDYLNCLDGPQRTTQSLAFQSIMEELRNLINNAVDPTSPTFVGPSLAATVVDKDGS